MRKIGRRLLARIANGMTAQHVVWAEHALARSKQAPDVQRAAELLARSIAHTEKAKQWMATKDRLLRELERDV